MTEDPLKDELARLSAEVEDCRALREEVEALREREKTYRILLDESSDPIFCFYPEGRYKYVNRAFADGVRRRQEDVIGRTIWDVFPKEEADKRFAAVKWVFENGVTKVLEVRVPNPEADRYYITTVKPIFDDAGAVCQVICISKEITERKLVEDKLNYLSTHDVLTGLYNRWYFEEHILRLQGSRLFPIGVIVADMDNLKEVNDSMGHLAGDDLIRAAGEIFKASFRSEEVVARVGGDEFSVLMTVSDQSSLEAAAQRLRDNLAKSSNQLVKLSVGASIAQKGELILDAIKRADDLMYKEKAVKKAASK